MRVLLQIAVLLVLLSPAFAEQREGEELYKKYCTLCHADGLANAPKAHDEAAWKARNKDISALIESSKKGINAMPPFGTCMDCTDSELKAAIEYMTIKHK